MRSLTAVLAAMLALVPLGARAADLVVWWDKGASPQEDAAVKEIIAAFEQKTGKHVELADMNTGFNSGTMFVSDNLHPNQAGYEFMAGRWYDVIGSRLPE